MANPIISTITLAPRVPKGRAIVTVTATDEVTVFITDEVTVYITDTVEVTESIFDTSFITTTATITEKSTTTESITTTETQTSTPTPTSPTTTKKETAPLIPFIRPIDSSTSLLPLPTPLLLNHPRACTCVCGETPRSVPGPVDRIRRLHTHPASPDVVPGAKVLQNVQSGARAEETNADGGDGDAGDEGGGEGWAGACGRGGVSEGWDLGRMRGLVFLDFRMGSIVGRGNNS